MTRKKWIEEIKKQCQSVGTYKPEFDLTIGELASILEQRDKITREYKKEGSKSVIPYVNKFGAENMIPNPMLKQIQDLTKIALPYWRDLGLTPAGLKKLHEDALKVKKRSALGEALMSLGG